MNNIEENHRSLRLLEEISRGGEFTQRDLSHRAGMALGLVNVYIKALVSKGYVKISGIPRKRYKYYLTPKGFKEKTRLTCNLLYNYTRIFKEARREYSRLFQELHASGVGKVFFAGLDDISEIAYLSLQEAELEFTCAVDAQPPRGGFFKARVLTFEELAGEEAPGHAVITTYKRVDETYRALLGAGVAREAIHSIYPLSGAPDTRGAR